MAEIAEGKYGYFRDGKEVLEQAFRMFEKMDKGCLVLHTQHWYPFTVKKQKNGKWKVYCRGVKRGEFTSKIDCWSYLYDFMA